MISVSQIIKDEKTVGNKGSFGDKGLGKQQINHFFTPLYILTVQILTLVIIIWRIKYFPFCLISELFISVEGVTIIYLPVLTALRTDVE